LLGHNLKRPYNDVHNLEFSGLLRTGLGLKFRLHPLSAVIVNHLLDNYAFGWVKSRNETLNYFSDKLKNIDFITPPIIKEYVTSMGAYYGYKPRVDFSALGISREEFLKLCKNAGLDIDEPGSKPFYHYELFINPGKFLNYNHKTNISDSFPNAEKYYQSAISIPTFTFFEDRDTIDVYIEKLKTIIEKITEGRQP